MHHGRPGAHPRYTGIRSVVSADRSSPVRAAASAAGSGSCIAPTLTTAQALISPTDPDLPTRSTYRTLVMRGLAPAEAANLTAFMSGIHVGDQSWNLKEVNQLLFLRDLQRSGRFEEADGSARPRLTGSRTEYPGRRGDLPPPVATASSFRSGAFPPPGAASGS